MPARHQQGKALRKGAVVAFSGACVISGFFSIVVGKLASWGCCGWRRLCSQPLAHRAKVRHDLRERGRQTRRALVSYSMWRAPDLSNGW